MAPWPPNFHWNCTTSSSKASLLRNHPHINWRVDVVTLYINVGGTSSAFHRLLEKSPHFAKYAQYLQILDYTISHSTSLRGNEWLPDDMFRVFYLSSAISRLSSLLCVWLGSPLWESLTQFAITVPRLRWACTSSGGFFNGIFLATISNTL